MRKRNIIGISAALCLAFAMPSMAQAEGMSMADKLQQAMSNQSDTAAGDKADDTAADSTQTNDAEHADNAQEQDDADDGTQGLSDAWKNLSAAQIVTGIKELDVDDPDIRKVRALRISYNKLSTSDRVKVINIETLSSAETRLGIDENGDALQNAKQSTTYIDPKGYNSPDTIEGRSYGFDMSEDATAFTLVLNYVTDENGDGAMDVPQITITSPDGESMAMSEKINSIKDTSTDIAVTWTSRYMQMDIKTAMAGQWAISSSLPVVYQRRTYAGGSLTPVTEAPMEPETDPLRIPVDDTQPDAFGGLIHLGLRIGLFLGAGVLFVLYIKKLFPSAPKPDENGKLEGARLETDDVEDEIQRYLVTDNEEQDKLGEEQDAEVRAQKEKQTQKTEEEQKQQADRDQHINETVTAEDEDNGLEISTEAVGDTALLSKGGTSQRKTPTFSRFS